MKLFSNPFLSLLVLGLPLFNATATERLIDRTLVTVNNEAILESDVTKFQAKLRSKSFQELFGGIDSSIAQNRETVLQLLVEERIINQQVKKLELSATDQEVDGQIRAILKRNGISQAQLTERLRQLDTSLADYRDGIKRQLERKNLIDREIRPSTEVTEEQLRHFYLRTNRSEGSENQYRIAHILVGLRAKGPAAWDDAKTKAEKIWRELSQNPEQFENLVKDYSDDEATRDSEGSLGFLSLSSLAKELRGGVIKTPVGQITKPIRMPDGFHILKVQEMKAADFTAIPKEARESIRNELIAQEVEKKMSLWLERKKRESNIHRIGATNEGK